MFEPSSLWAVFTVIAAAAQTVRNAAQRELTGRLGTVGATHVRFLFGCPFAVLFLVAVLATGAALPRPAAIFWPWILAGALMQIAATALMLAAMSERSFVVAIAYIKTEPVQVALFGLVFLGDAVTPLMAVAIAIATAGVIAMASPGGKPAQGGSKAGEKAGEATAAAASPMFGSRARPTLVGLAAGGAFALSAIGYRGAILSLGDPNYVMAATYTLTVGLVIQSALLSSYLALRDPAVLAAIVRAWKPSLFAGFMGALASQFWFLAFALATAASVRTLALVEVLFAQAISHFVFRQPVTRREAVGVGLIVIGVVSLIWAY